MVEAAASFVVVVDVDAFSLFSGRWGQNFAMCPICLHPPAPGASSLHHHHHLPVPADQCFRDGFEAIPGQAQPEGIVPVGCPGRGSEEVEFLDVSVGA